MSILAAAGLGTASCSAESNGITVLTPQEFIANAKADTTGVILDVRTLEEYNEGHLSGARQLDFLNTEAFDAGIKLLDKAPTYYVYCRSGRRSHAACEKMQKMGMKVYDMEGGFINWQKQGMPVSK